MIVKKQFSIYKVLLNIKWELTTVFIVSTSVWYFHTHTILSIPLPFSIAAILGSALAIFIAFRNQSSYARWWEARTIWGSIINNSRIFARQLIANAENAGATGKATQAQVQSFTREMVYRQIAFAYALRLHLRKQNSWQELQHLLSDAEFQQLLQAQNKPNMLLHTQGLRIKDAMRIELLGAFDNISMEPNLATFNNWQGSCERIKNTPLPMNYQYFTKLFLYVFMVVLPFCLVVDFDKLQQPELLIPVSLLVTFMFSIMNRVGEINESPFENQMMDIPMTALCNTIERDLKEMLGESQIPDKTEPLNGYLY